jgi:hypothetical protein
MALRKQVAALPNSPRAERTAPAASDSMGRRALLVLVLTPTLIFFMSRKDVGHAANKAEARAQLFEQWPSSGTFRAAGLASINNSGRRGRIGCARALSAIARCDYDRDPRSADLIYARAMFFAGKYDSRPYWNRGKLRVGVPTDRATADLAIEHLIPCESMGKTVNRIDSNGKMSYGILQFQDWDQWEAGSGLRGDPDNREDAIRMAEWAVENGMVNHWTCAQILKISDERLVQNLNPQINRERRRRGIGDRGVARGREGPIRGAKMESANGREGRLAGKL